MLRRSRLIVVRGSFFVGRSVFQAACLPSGRCSQKLSACWIILLEHGADMLPGVVEFVVGFAVDIVAGAGVVKPERRFIRLRHCLIELVDEGCFVTPPRPERSEEVLLGCAHASATMVPTEREDRRIWSVSEYVSSLKIFRHHENTFRLFQRKPIHVQIPEALRICQSNHLSERETNNDPRTTAAPSPRPPDAALRESAAPRRGRTFRRSPRCRGKSDRRWRGRSRGC